MLNFGFWEMILVMALALVVIGPERLPEVLRFLGRQYGKLMRASNELRRAFMLEAETVEVERRAEELRKRREEARKRLQAQREADQANDRDDPFIAPQPASFTPVEPRIPGVTLVPPQGQTLVPPSAPTIVPPAEPSADAISTAISTATPTATPTANPADSEKAREALGKLEKQR